MSDKFSGPLIKLQTREYGMTLIEIMAVIAIISILSAVAVPVIISILPDYRLRAAISDLYSNLQRAKQEAVRSNGECGVYLDVANNRYQVIAGGPDGVCDGPAAGFPPLPLNDDILINYMDLSDYGSGVRYGSGTAKKTVPGGNIPPIVTVSYVNDRIRFDAKGMARELGYIYLTNVNSSAYAVGTPSISGSIVQKRWLETLWE
ncbi:putative Prepilin-type N-terminal cleavage/methylation domain-containing protein [uncultured Desulfobacterium sp.]|uniref:Putative Prepilin-type N-terminal cleavage/methylation domain-containing protein n=1 Tax=uncultured Desulfobacterium sp. TaxID=201089 RepID=A0A445MSD3_9BACT|nr:putative Prepilin-type N-terminal cleavage/methylation domain-containing protein [uncultured Desulfobacterium sp.]